MMRTLIFDLDNTLIDTQSIRNYRTTAEGREYLIKNIGRLPTRLISPQFRGLIKEYANRRTDNVFIVTNSGFDIASALLRKHHFPDNTKIICGAEKPSKRNFEEAVGRINLGDVLTIGDLPIDILFSHECKFSSVAFNYGIFSIEENLRKAEPNSIIKNPEELEKILIDFESGRIKYQERQLPKEFEFCECDEEMYSKLPEVKFEHLEIYHPWGSQNKNKFTGEILDLKRAKYYGIDQLNFGERIQFFYDGQMIIKGTYSENIVRFYKRVYKKIEEMNLNQEDTLFIAAPNSLPEFCYGVDLNNRFVEKIKEKFKFETPKERGIYRVFPVVSSALTGNRNPMQKHIESLGIKSREFRKTYKNVVIFDDIKTIGTQINAIATILKSKGIGENFIGLTLGETYFDRRNGFEGVLDLGQILNK